MRSVLRVYCNKQLVFLFFILTTSDSCPLLFSFDSKYAEFHALLNRVFHSKLSFSCEGSFRKDIGKVDGRALKALEQNCV